MPSHRDNQLIPIDVFLSGDVNVFVGIIASSSSFLQNLSGYLPRFTVIEKGFDKEIKRDIEISLKCAGHPFELAFLSTAEIDYQGLELTGYASTAYGKFLIPEHSATQWSIYLDCDLIVRGDFAEILGSLDAQTALYSTVNYPSKSFGEQKGLDLEALCISPDEPYFNSGLLIINNELWRALRIKEHAFNLLRENQFMTYDQDALNILLRDKWKALPESWNYQLFEDRHPLPSNKVIHYSGKMKPWHYCYDFQKGKPFWDTLNATRLCSFRPKFDIYHWLRSSKARPALAQLQYRLRKCFGFTPFKRRGT